MTKKILSYLILLSSILSFSQSESDIIQGTYEDYNGFSTRNFMKFNSFFTVPTFSVLHRDDQTIEAITRSSNIAFEDASRLHILSYSGKMRENSGAGAAVFQQEIGVFKDFGAILNYAHQITMSENTKLALGFNFFYSRRSINGEDVITQAEDQIVSNFQDIPILNLQPAVTFSFKQFNLGVFMEDLAYYNLKSNQFTSGLSEKTISAHAGYSNRFTNFSGLLENSYFRLLGIARRSQLDGFTFAGNLMYDLPKAGWLKVGYDSFFGLNAGFGINLNERISVGYAYENNDNLGATNEIGLLYTFKNNNRTARTNNRRPTIDIVLPENNRGRNDQQDPADDVNDPGEVKDTPVAPTPVYKDLSDEVKRAQDSINKLNNKMNEIIELLKNQPKQTEVIREIRTEPAPAQPTGSSGEELDTSLRRRTATPWRNQYTVRSGGGAGSMYYVALDQFKDVNNANALIQTYKRRNINVKKVRDPKTKIYYVYEERYKKKEDADRVKEELNTGGGIDEGEGNNGMQITVKKKYSDPVYVVKITFGSSGETYRVRKTQPRAKVRTLPLVQEGIEPGYYLQVNVFSKKPYADRFIDELRRDGINANYYLNPKTGYRHVYILKTDDREEAIRQYNNNLNGTYYDRKSIININ